MTCFTGYPSISGGLLQRDVGTGYYTMIMLPLFQVQNVTCPARWDPSSELLTVSYDIADRFSLIRNGRIRYVTQIDGRVVTICHQYLTFDQRQQGRGHQMLECQRWNGTITEGLDGRPGTEDRRGQKVTADLSPVGVIVEVWNTTAVDPAPLVWDRDGPTQRPGEWLSFAHALTAVDAIFEARWDKHWCIPYDDPDEPDKGGAGMHISTRNVRDGTPVWIGVYRIGDVADANSDLLYAHTGDGPQIQPGLQGCVVHNNEVKRRATAPAQPGAAGGSYPPPRDLPYVLFNQYDKHWVAEGNNFYAFRVAFGDAGVPQVASQRDYLKHELECLHMRFVVLVHLGADDAESRALAYLLHELFANKTYFRCYGSIGSEKAADWIRYYSHRYIVIFCGHADVKCWHPAHPKREVGIGAQAPDEPLELYYCGFAPDQYRCPKDLEDELAHKRVAAILGRGSVQFGGCNYSSHVSHQLVLSPDERWRFGNRAGTNTRTALVLADMPTQAGQPQYGIDVPMRSGEPRFLFYSGGCRTMLTTNFGEHFVRNRTRYFHGWVYTVLLTENRAFALDLFSRWINGTSAGQAQTPQDLACFERAYHDAAVRTTCHPRLMTWPGALIQQPAPAATGGALR